MPPWPHFYSLGYRQVKHLSRPLWLFLLQPGVEHVPRAAFFSAVSHITYCKLLQLPSPFHQTPAHNSCTYHFSWAWGDCVLRKTHQSSLQKCNQDMCSCQISCKLPILPLRPYEQTWLMLPPPSYIPAPRGRLVHRHDHDDQALWMLPPLPYIPVPRGRLGLLCVFKSLSLSMPPSSTHSC